MKKVSSSPSSSEAHVIAILAHIESYLAGRPLALKRWNEMTKSTQKQLARFVAFTMGKKAASVNLRKIVRILESESGTGKIMGIPIKPAIRRSAPNQALEPTSLGVTPRADARVAPPKDVAHLER